MKYVLALIIGTIFGYVSYFLSLSAFDTVNQFIANPDNVGLLVGSVMTVAVSFACVLATVVCTYIQLTDDY